MYIPCIYGDKEFDFYDGIYSTTSQATYTFSQNLKEVYVAYFTNNVANHGTYTGNGYMTNVYQGASNTYQGVNKITNVSSGDKFKSPAASVAGSSRTMLTMFGIKA